MPLFQDFSGLWIPLITPFHDGPVDHPALTRLVEKLKGSGVKGFVACGSTGEAAALSGEEQLAVLRTVLQAAQGAPVLMGMSGYNLAEALAWTKGLNRYPIQGLLVPAPCYIRPSQSGLLQWFEAIASASEHALIIYDIPYRTGARLALETMLRLARHPHIKAVKDCGGDRGKTQALLAESTLQILAGEDAQIFELLALGGVGAIAASAHLATRHFVELFERLRKAELEPARQLWRCLRPWVDAAFAEPNPAAIKAMLAHQGLVRNELRAPMTPASAMLEEKLRGLGAQLSLL